MLQHITVNQFETVIRQMKWFLRSDWITHRVFILWKYPVHAKNKSTPPNFKKGICNLFHFILWSTISDSETVVLNLLVARLSSLQKKRLSHQISFYKDYSIYKHPNAARRQHWNHSRSDELPFVAAWHRGIFWTIL